MFVTEGKETRIDIQRVGVLMMIQFWPGDLSLK